MYIEVHTITDHNVCCPNRGKDGFPKQVNYGGFDHASVATQAWKRAIKILFCEDPLMQNKVKVQRSREWPELLVADLVKAGKKEADAIVSVKAAFATLGLGLGKKKTGDEEETEETEEVPEENGRRIEHLTTMIDLDSDEYKGLLLAVKENYDELLKRGEKATKSKDGLSKSLNKFHEKKSTAILIAVGGRFCASFPDMTTDGAVEVAHAISCNEMVRVENSFVAMDDVINKVANMGTSHFWCNPLYQYLNINLTTLSKNLGDDTLVPQVVVAYIRAAILLILKAKRTSSADRSLPCFVRVRISDMPISAHGAYEVPIRAMGDTAITKLSIQAHLQHTAAIDKAYGRGRPGGISAPKLDVFYTAGKAVSEDWKPDADLIGNAGTTNCQDMIGLLQAVSKALTK